MLELQKNSFIVRQVYEIAEHFGFETRNKYQVLDEDKREILYIAEQQKGVLGFLFRQFLGHWRRFNLHVFDSSRKQIAEARHPFRFFFQRFELYDANGTFIGALQQRFAFFRRRFDVQNPNGEVVLEVRTRILTLLGWNFPFFRGDREVARIDKKFTGALAELFTDKDTFHVTFNDPTLAANERLLIITAAVFVDLQYFETKD